MSNAKIKKLIISGKELKKAQDAIENNTYVQLAGNIESFDSKEEYKDKTILQKSIIIVDWNGNVLLTQRADTENTGKRITTGHSIIVSSSNHDSAIQKLSNVPNDKEIILQKIIQNKNYIFDVIVYQVADRLSHYFHIN
jgi:hypothetical protein